MKGQGKCGESPAYDKIELIEGSMQAQARRGVSLTAGRTGAAHSSARKENRASMIRRNPLRK